MTPHRHTLSVALLLAVSLGVAAPAAEAPPPASPVGAFPAISVQMMDLAAAFTRRDHAAFQTLLEQHPALARDLGPGGRPWLVLAAEQGFTNLVTALLAAKAEANAAVLGSQETALHAAARGTHAEIVRLLLASRADVNARAADGSTPLHLAIPPEFFQVLASPAPSPSPALVGPRPVAPQVLLNVEGNPAPRVLRIRPLLPQLRAIPDLNDIEFALPSARPAEPDAQRERRETAARRQSIIAQLAAAGADLFATNAVAGPATPWLRALHFRHTNLLDTLLLHTPRVRDRDAAGDTPAHLAVRHARFHTLPALVAKQADLTATNAAGLTPLQLLVLLAPPPALAHDATDPAEPPGYFVLLGLGAKPDPFSLAGLGKVAELTAALQRDPALVHARDPQGRTLFHWAAMKGNLATIALLLARGADVNARDGDGNTALHLAAQAGYLPLTDTLVQRKADVNATNQLGQTALHLAVATPPPHSSALVKQLVAAGANANLPDADGNTPLHRAVTGAAAREVVQALLDVMAEPGPTNKLGQTPWQVATSAGRPIGAEIENLLIEAGAAPDYRDKDGNTPFHLAARRASIPALQRLLRQQPDRNATNRHGQTPLHLLLAVPRFTPDPELKALLLAGAQLERADGDGDTLLHLAAQAGNDGFVRTLLDAKVNPNATNRYGRTPLALAIAARPAGHLRVAGRLLENGGNPNLADDDGNTPLHLAAQADSEDFTKTLLAARANPNVTNRFGRTPLELAIAAAPGSNYLAVVGRLLVAGANPNGVDRNGDTLLHRAVLARDAALARTLLERAANPDPNPTNKIGQTPMQLALTLRPFNAALASALAGARLDVAARDRDGNTLLHDAALLGDTEAMRWLLERKADPNATNRLGQTPLHVVRSPVLVVPNPQMQALLDGGAKPDAVDGDGNTALHLAAKANNQSFTQTLIKAQAILNATNRKGQTPLAVFMEHGPLQYPYVATYLLHGGANPYATNGEGNTLLHLAAKEGMESLVRGMRTYQANPNATNLLGETPLHLAAANATRATTIRALIESHANPLLPNLKGETPIQVGLRSGLSRDLFYRTVGWNGLAEVARVNDLDSMQAFLEADPSLAQTPDNFGNRPLHWAAQLGNLQMIELLIEKGAQVDGRAAVTNAAVPSGQPGPRGGSMTNLPSNSYVPPTPLHLATAANQREAALLLIARGATVDLHTAASLGLIPTLEKLLAEAPQQINSLASRGTMLQTIRHNGASFTTSHNPRTGTPVQFALASGQQAAAEWLLKRGADINAADAAGYTSLYHALKSGNEAKAAELQRQGAVIDLFTAISLGRRDRVAALLTESSGWMAMTNRLRRTPLPWAIMEGQEAIARMLVESNAPVKSLLPERIRPPPNLQWAADRGVTVLHMAAARNFTNLGALLLARGAEVNVMDQLGLAPLHYAAAYGATEFTALLLTNQASANLQAFSTNLWRPHFFPLGRTPLQLAVQYGRHQIAALLLSHGADVHATNFAGSTAVRLAKYGDPALSTVALWSPGVGPGPLPTEVLNDRRMIELLVRHGAVEPLQPPDNFPPRFGPYARPPLPPRPAPPAPAGNGPRAPAESR